MNARDARIGVVGATGAVARDRCCPVSAPRRRLQHLLPTSPGAFLRRGQDGQQRVELTPTQRLPKLWPPSYVLISAGAALIAPGFTFFVLSFVDSSVESEEFSTWDGLGTLAVSAALLGSGIYWLRKRQAERRRIRGLSAWGAGDPNAPGVSLGMQGLGRAFSSECKAGRFDFRPGGVAARFDFWIPVQVSGSFRRSIVIGRLTGIIVDQTLDGACVVDVSGVGYEVFVPLGALGRPRPS